jgi:FtsP/CotA-like multicopper oxidase with cupredoxin domain
MRSTLICALALAAGCTQAPDDEPLRCATPGDFNATADITITARDVGIAPAPDVVEVAWSYDGDVPGPVLRIPLGAERRVKLVNRSPRATSLHFHGLSYSADDDGTPEHDASMVASGCAHIYTLTAVQPGVWPYHSHRDARVEMAAGLYGAVVVPADNETPADHEYVALLGQIGIEDTTVLTGEAAEAAGAPTRDFFMTINGRPDGTAEVIALDGDHYVASQQGRASARVGDHVRWRVANLSPDDAHTFHIHGHRWCDGGGLPPPGGTCAATDDVALLPAQGTTLEYIEDSPGEWMFHCHVLDHVTDGMWAMYDVTE